MGSIKLLTREEAERPNPRFLGDVIGQLDVKPEYLLERLKEPCLFPKGYYLLAKWIFEYRKDFYGLCVTEDSIFIMGPKGKKKFITELNKYLVDGK